MVNLVRQYHELDKLLAAVNEAVRQAESIYSRGVSAEADLHTAVESMRAAREIVRGAIDQTGGLIDEASE
jgi:hypothetical protein